MNLGELTSIIDSYQGKKVAVIGDIILDHYLWGKVERISPEAPVPVVDVDKEEYRLGGAANVVYNLRALAAKPYPIGITGDDLYGEQIFAILQELGIDCDNLFRDKSRPTTRKSRIIAHQQQVVRIDYESRKDCCQELEERIVDSFKNMLPAIDGVVIQDYNKGLLTPKVIAEVLKMAADAEIPVAVDPKFKNFFLYRKATLFKPNIAELQKNTGLPVETEEELNQAARILMHKLDPEHLIITRGEKGMTVFSKKGNRTDIPTFAQEVFDVSGAGDTVISALILGLCAGVSIEKASLIANHSAGAVCGKFGIHPAYKEDIINSFKNYNKL